MGELTTKTSDYTGAGEVVESQFIRVVFQKGFPRDVGINGVRIQDLIEIAIDRLNQYQKGPLPCEENAQAIAALETACQWLDERVRRREEQGVFNTSKPHETIRTEDEVDDFSATGA